MSDKLKSFSDLVTAWILKAFLSFVPKIQGRKMGAAFSGRGIEPIQPFPLYKILPTSEKIYSFLTLPTACYILPTAYLGATPKIVHLCPSPKSFCPSLGSFSYSLTSFRYSLKSFSSSPKRFCPRFGGCFSRI